MPSTTLYPPSLNLTADAFVVSDDAKCTIYYSLSKISSTPLSQIKGYQFVVYRQATGLSAIKRKSTGNRFRSTGICIVNDAPTPVEGKNNLYKFDIYNDDIAGDDTDEHDKGGFKAGYIYRVQMRLSTVVYNPDDKIGEQDWLTENAKNFSEWSTYCTTRAIEEPEINLYTFNSTKMFDGNKYKSDVLDLKGTYSCPTDGENLYSYVASLYKGNAENKYNLLETTGDIYPDRFSGNNIDYVFKTLLEENQEDGYTFVIYCTSTNKHISKKEYNFLVELNDISVDFDIATLDDDPAVFPDGYTIFTEEEEGRIGVVLYNFNTAGYHTNADYYLRRSSSKDAFATWEDIMLIDLSGSLPDALLYFDYTAESGIWYKYGIQPISKGTEVIVRSPMKQTAEVVREFEFAYLLGEHNQQLKLKFNNNLDTYKPVLSESKTDTIGGRFPIFGRNAVLNYKQIPVTGLISFEMDEMNTFLKEENIYGEKADLYMMSDTDTPEERERKRRLVATKERLFRDKVIDFLQNGKPKLFKSSSEGNILLRLMDISAKPEQKLNRMIYSFTATGYECAEATVDNYKKYKLLSIEEVTEAEGVNGDKH